MADDPILRWENEGGAVLPWNARPADRAPEDHAKPERPPAGHPNDAEQLARHAPDSQARQLDLSFLH